MSRMMHLKYLTHLLASPLTSCCSILDCRSSMDMRLRKIREGSADGVVLVALTGWGQEEDRRKSRDAGFNAHLIKPVDFNVLKEILSDLPGSNGA